MTTYSMTVQTSYGLWLFESKALNAAAAARYISAFFQEFHYMDVNPTQRPILDTFIFNYPVALM